ncbi:MAG: hypothetical protein ACT4PL_01755 [Phycisphaerales bacterium]
MPSPLLLRNLSFLGKLGLSGLVLTLLMGLAASAQHIVDHYQNRDERPGLTRDDLVSAYSGLNAPAPIQQIVSNGHPGGVTINLAEPAKDALTRWLASDRIAENYDNIDFADPTPRDILNTSCVSCHGQRSEDAKARANPLETWDQVKKHAFRRTIERTPDKVKAISTHTHALALGSLSIAVAALFLATGLPRLITGFFIALTGLALMADIAGWWLASYSSSWVSVIIVAGGCYNGGTVIMLLLILLLTWLPRRSGPVA